MQLNNVFCLSQSDNTRDPQQPVLPDSVHQGLARCGHRYWTCDLGSVASAFCLDCEMALEQDTGTQPDNCQTHQLGLDNAGNSRVDPTVDYETTLNPFPDFLKLRYIW